MKIREDRAGSGRYGSSRGSRKHKGVDISIQVGEKFPAPFAMEIKRISKPYPNEHYSGVAFETKWCEGRIWYIEPESGIVGKRLEIGDYVGTVQDRPKRNPGDGMTPHVHFQIDLVDPAIFFGLLNSLKEGVDLFMGG